MKLNLTPNSIWCKSFCFLLILSLSINLSFANASESLNQIVLPHFEIFQFDNYVEAHFKKTPETKKAPKNQFYQVETISSELNDCDDCPPKGTYDAFHRNRSKFRAAMNPDFDPGLTCELKVALVMDESTSISQGGLQAQLASGALTFLQSIADKDIEVALIDFDYTAEIVIPYTVVTSQTLENNLGSSNDGIFYDYLYNGGYGPNGYTNWEDAFIKVNNLPEVPDLVIFVTDGDPTAYINANNNCAFGCSYSSFDDACYGTNSGCASEALSQAEDAADVVKNNGSHIFVLGYPNPSLNFSNVQTISGLDEYSGGVDFAQADYIRVTSNDLLQQAFSNIGAEICGIDLELTKTADKTAVSINEQLTFELTVTNNGNVEATDIEVEDILPSGFSYVSSSPVGDYTSNTGTWDVGDLLPQASSTLFITVTTNASGNYDNCAEVSEATGSDADSTPGNGVASEDDYDCQEIIVCDLSCLAIPVNTSCSCLSDGSISVTGQGGSAPYTFDLNGNTNITGEFNNLAAGDYTVTITDANNCVSSCDVTIGSSGSTLSVSCPDPVVMTACDTQADIDAAYATWLGQFATNGGCSPTSTDLSVYQTAPSACSDEDIVVTINYSASDDCNEDSCSSTFTIPAQTELTVSCPDPVVMTACDTQADIDAAYATWLGQFATNGGCSPTSTDLSSYQTAPSACASEDIVVTINYSASDDCNEDSCSSSFTVPAQPSLEVSCPSDYVANTCMTQEEFDIAWNNWLGQFGGTGGCGDGGSFSEVPVKPTRTEIGSTTGIWSYDDGCNSDNCSAQFIVENGGGLVLNCPDDEIIGTCLTQQQVNDAFDAWLGSFSFSTCCSTSSAEFDADYSQVELDPCGESITVQYTATDECGNSENCSRTFTVPSSPQLTVSCPDPVVMTACDTQADIDAAYATWLGQFATNGGCSPTSTDLSSYQTAPSACSDQDIVVTINYSASDDCNEDSCSSSFTVPAQPSLEVSCPSDYVANTCMTQEEFDIAWNNWLGQFGGTGGCGDGGSFSEVPVKPTRTEIGSTTGIWSYDDGCNSDNCSAQFIVENGGGLVLNCPDDEIIGTCLTQQQVNDAFDAWLGSFSFSTCCSTSSAEFDADYSQIELDPCGESITVQYTATDECGNSENCSRTFTVPSSPQLTVSCPDPVVMTACDTQADIDAAYATWLGQFATNGGCSPTSTDLSSYQTAPSACSDEDIVVTINYSASDDCNEDSCSSTFTIPAQTELTVSCPDPVVMTACDTQADIDAAYATWLGQFATNGGCSPTSTDLSVYQTAPSACSDEDIVVTINYSASDDCNEDSCSSSFTVPAQPSLEVSCPSDYVANTCMTQEEFDIAWNNWLGQFGGTGGCGDGGSFSEVPVKPTRTEIGSTTGIWIYDDGCNSDNCSAQFIVENGGGLVLNCPDDEIIGTCLTQQQVNDAFDAWLGSFSFSTCCSTSSAEFDADYSQVELDPCGESITVQYTATDECGNSENCSRTFTVPSSPQLTVSCPDPVVMTACDTQADIDAAYATWLGQFTTNGGCSPTSTDLSSYQTAPSACSSEDIVVTINYSASDDCNEDSCSSSFTIPAQTELTVSCPDPVVMTACDTQADIDAAYATWLAQFATNGGCSPTSTDLSVYQTAPSACSDEDIVVTINYSASDDCNEDSCSSSFTIPAQTELTVSCPDPVVMTACDTQADIDAAYATWLGQFATNGGCSPTSTDLSSYQTAPSACSSEDIVVTINYSASDDCNEDSCSSSFTIPAQTELTVSCPDPVVMTACDTQADIDAAYATWLGQFTTNGGCSPTSTDLSSYQTAPSACSSEDIVVTINYSASDDCNEDSCSSSFTIPAQTELTVSCPDPVVMTACDTQADIDAAYATWLGQFATNGGCSPTSTDLSSYQTAPSACSSEDIVVTINYSASDDCNEDSCSSSFTIPAQTELTVSCPDPVVMTACDTQADIDAAYATWLGQFSTNGGCSPTSTDLSSYQIAPSACSDEDIVVTINYSASDDCNEDSCSSSFTIPAQTELTVSCPDPVVMTACDTQADIDAAYATWLGQFATNGGCSPTSTDLSSYQTAPSACSSEDIVVTINYSASDDCNEDSCSSSFTIPAQTELTVSCPDPVVMTACDTQADIDAAYATWLGQFSTNGGCSPTSTDLSSYQTAPSACSSEDIVVTINYSASDDCNEDSCSSTFTIPAQTELTVSCPDPVVMTACDTQADIDAAYATWLGQFATNGGCSPTSTDLSSFQTAPSACSSEDIVVTINYSASDDCNEDSCSSSFTIPAQTELTVSCPDPVVMTACDTQADIDAAYATWLGQFTTNGGCSPTSTDLSSYQTAPSACSSEDIVVTINYSASDDCNEDSCSSSFTIPAQTELTVSCPDPVVMTACDTQADIDAAYATWLGQFTTNGGCSPTSTDLSSYQTAPSACSDEDIVVTINYSASDDCNEDSCSSSFTIPAQTELTVSCPDPVVMTACDTQADIDAAYATWLGQFATNGGCSPTSTDLSSYQTAPSACSDEDIVVTINYSASDDCNEDSCSSSFTIPAQTELTVSCPDPVVMTACDTQADIDAAYATWLGQFATNGGCSPTSTDLSSYQTAPSACSDEDIVVTINYSASDDCNEDSCSSSFTIPAQTELTVSCPDPVVMTACDTQADIDAAYATWLGQFATNGGCSPTSTDLSSYQTAPSACSSEDIVVTINYSASDDCNEESCSSTFTIPAEPVFEYSCPEDFTAPLCLTQTEVDVLFNDWLKEFEYSGGCDVVIETENDTTIPASCGGTTTVTWTMTGGCGLEEQCQATFTVPTNRRPILSSAQDRVVECDGSGNTAQLNAWLNSHGGAAAMDDCNMITWSNNFTGLSDLCGETGSATVTFTVTDHCGLSASTTATFTIIDTNAPTIIPDNPSINGLESGDTWVVQCFGKDPTWEVPSGDEGFVIVEDDCSDADDIEVTYTEELVADGDCVEEGFKKRYKYTWTATDDCGNSDEYFVYVEIVDTIPPVITGFDAVIEVNCLDDIPSETVIATDECQCAELTFEDTPLQAGCIDGQSITRTYTAVDCCGNVTVETQQIVFVDNEGPNIVIDSEILAGVTPGQALSFDCNEGGAPYVYNTLNAEDVVALDGCGEVASLDYETEKVELQDCATTGYQNRTIHRWIATDICGNSNSIEIYIDEYDTVAPEFLSSMGSVCVSSMFDVPWPEVDDFGCSQPLIDYYDIEYVDECGRDCMQRVWEATDACGNMTTATQLIYGEEDMSMNMEFNNGSLIEVGSGGSMKLSCDASSEGTSLTGFTANDVNITTDCPSSTSLTFTENIISDFTCVDGLMTAQVEAVWTAQSDCGMEERLSVKVQLIDDRKPTIANFSPEIVVGCDPAELEIEVEDACTEMEILVRDGEGITEKCPNVYSYDRMITLIDGCGNEFLFEQRVTIRDEEGPIMTELSPTICEPTELPNVVAWDECMGREVPVTFVEEDVPGCPDGTVKKRTYRAEDACGNETVFEQYITYNDNHAPDVLIKKDIINELKNRGTVVVNLSDAELYNAIININDLDVVGDDGCDPNVTRTFSENISDDYSCVEDGFSQLIEYRWIFEDACGNTSQVDISVEVVDDVAPKLTYVPRDKTIYCGDVPPIDKISVEDDSEYEVEFTEVVDGDIIYRIWIVTDICGNVTEYTQTIIMDNESDLSCEIDVDQTIYCNSHGNPIHAIVTGGTAPYTYEWEAITGNCYIQSGGTSPTAYIYVGFNSVEVQLTVTDANGCQTVCTYEIVCQDILNNPLGLTADGDADYGYVAEVEGANEGIEDLVAYPNPAKEIINLSFSSEMSGDTKLVVHNRLNQVVKELTVRKELGNNQLRLNTENLLPGQYFISVFSDSQIQRTSFIKVGR